MKNTLYILLVLFILLLEVISITDCDILENNVTVIPILDIPTKISFYAFCWGLPATFILAILSVEKFPLNNQQKADISFLKIFVYLAAYIVLCVVFYKSLKTHSFAAYALPLISICLFTCLFLIKKLCTTLVISVVVPILFNLFIGGWIQEGQFDCINLKISNRSDVSLANIPSNIAGATIENCTFKKILKVKGVNANHSTLIACNFSAVKNIEQCIFSDAQIGGSNFSQTEVYNCNFENIRTTIDRKSKSDLVRMDSCLIIDTSFKGANVNNVNFSNTTFQNCHFNDQTESTFALFINAKMTQIYGLAPKHIQYCNKIKGAELPPHLTTNCE